MRVSHRIVGLMLLGMILTAPLYAQSEQPDLARVVHTPATFINVGQPLTLNAYLENVQDRGVVEEARIWHKGRNDDVYDYVDMFRSGDGYSGTIRATDIPSEGLDYYIEFTFSDGSVLTYPEVNPQDQPVHVNVRSAATEAGTSPLVIISPEPFTKVRGEVLVAVAFNQSVRLIDPQKVRLLVNGKDRTRQVQISEEILIGVISGLKPGRTRVDINYLGDKGKENLGNFTFTVEQGTTSGVEQELRGSFASEERTQKVNSLEQNIARQTMSLSYNVGKFSIIGQTLLTSEEQGTLQPQHRYSVDIGFTGFRIRGGDVKPRYNELVLWGKRVRGLEMEVNSRPFGLSLLYGYTKRGINGRESFGLTTDSAGVEIPDTTIQFGTYRRWLAAARLRFGDKDKVSLGFMAMKAKDDTSSIKFGDAAVDNVVLGTSFAAYFDRRRIAFTAEAALSITSNDIRTAPFDDAKDFADFIVINSYLDPLPDSGLPDSTGGSLDFTAVGKSILNQSGSYKARLRLRYLNNDVQVGYRLINRSYQTLGNPTLTNDRQGYFLRDRIRLFRSSLYLNAGYDHYFDNVTGKGDVRNQYDQISAGFNIYTSPALPDIAFSYSDFNNSNDGQLNIYQVTEPDPITGTPGVYDTTDTRQENRTGSWTMSLSQALSFGNVDNNLTLLFQNSDRTDQYNSYGAAQANLISATVRSMYGPTYMSTISFSNQKSTSIDNLTDLTYQMLSLRGDVFLFNRKLIPYFGPRITMGSGNNAMLYVDPASTISASDYNTPEDYQAAVDAVRSQSIRNMIVDFRRIDWLGGFRWNVFRNQSIEGMFRLTSYLENSKFEYWNGATFSVNNDVVQNGSYTLQQPTPLNRNDVIASIQYQLRF